MEFLFFFSAGCFIYTFIGYPIILLLLTKNKNSTALLPIDIDIETYPELSVVICIYNGADKLEARINNILTSNYPENKLSIIVVSDGSTDSPEKVINKMALSNVKLIHYNENKGKTYAINIGVAEVKTSLIAFADVRQTFCPNALKYLTLQFKDSKVGAASGNLKILSSDNKSEDPGLYWRYEKWIRQNESKIHSLLGVTGAIYMARTALIPEVPHNSLLDDMFIPLCMVKKGYKIKFVEEAVAYDQSSATLKEEFYRKVRTLAGNFQLLTQLPWLLSPVKNPLFWQFLSHKVMRLFMPYALIIALITSYFSEALVLNILFFLQLNFYSYSYMAYQLIKKGVNVPFSSICASFCSLQIAAIVAGWKYYLGNPLSLWRKH